MTTAEHILELLASHRFDASDEDAFQRGVARVLDEAGVSYRREKRLSDRDRIDFLTDRVGIELKVDGGSNAVLAQLYRYAESDCVDELVLVTTRSKHLNLPRVLQGKPLHVHFQGGL